MPNSAKKKWTAPKILTFQTPDQILRHFENKQPDAINKLKQFLDRMPEIKQSADSGHSAAQTAVNARRQSDK